MTGSRWTCPNCEPAVFELPPHEARKAAPALLFDLGVEKGLIFFCQNRTPGLFALGMSLFCLLIAGILASPGKGRDFGLVPAGVALGLSIVFGLFWFFRPGRSGPPAPALLIDPKTKTLTYTCDHRSQTLNLSDCFDILLHLHREWECDTEEGSSDVHVSMADGTGRWVDWGWVRIRMQDGPGPYLDLGVGARRAAEDVSRSLAEATDLKVVTQETQFPPTDPYIEGLHPR